MKIAYWYRVPFMWRRRVTKDYSHAVSSTDVLDVGGPGNDMAASPGDSGGSDAFDGGCEPMLARGEDV